LLRATSSTWELIEWKLSELLRFNMVVL